MASKEPGGQAASDWSDRGRGGKVRQGFWPSGNTEPFWTLDVASLGDNRKGRL